MTRSTVEAPAADWSEEQDRILGARFRTGICEWCTHFAHTPSGCDTKPIRFGLLHEKKCACSVGE